MALAAFNGQALDIQGNAITAFQVEVRHETPGAQLAAIFSDRDGLTPLSNPFTPSPSDNGYFRLHVAAGAYRIRVFTAGGDVANFRYVAIGLGAESDVLPFPGFLMTFNSGTTPTGIVNGEVRANNANLSLATELYISVNDRDGNSIQDRLLGLGAGDIVLLAQSGDQASYVVGSATVGSPAIYVTVAVSQHDGVTSLAAGANTSLQLQLQGPAGDVTTSGAVVAGQLARFASASPLGSIIEGAATDDSPPAAIKVGTDSQVRSAADGALIHAGHLESASAPVALVASPLALDWDSGINFTLEISQNSVLPNPINGQPGTWRTVLVSGNITSPQTPRTLTFGNQYLGELPSLTDITDTQKYLLMIYCVTATHFVVSAKEAQ